MMFAEEDGVCRSTGARETERRCYSSLQEFLAELNQNCLLLARHGETDWNAKKIIQGQRDRPLNSIGVAQSENLLSLLRPVPLHRICCSTLQRSIKTAVPISVEKTMNIEQRPELNEIRLGAFEGQHKERGSDEFSWNRYQSFLDDEINVVPPGGGENLRMVDERVRDLVSNCVATVANSGNVLIVGHRNVNKMIIRNLMGLSLEEGYNVEHKNNWLYVFTPQKAEIFLTKIPSSLNKIQVLSGYEKIVL